MKKIETAKQFFEVVDGFGSFSDVIEDLDIYDPANTKYQEDKLGYLVFRKDGKIYLMDGHQINPSKEERRSSSIYPNNHIIMENGNKFYYKIRANFHNEEWRFYVKPQDLKIYEVNVELLKELDIITGTNIKLQYKIYLNDHDTKIKVDEFTMAYLEVRYNGKEYPYDGCQSLRIPKEGYRDYDFVSKINCKLDKLITFEEIDIDQAIKIRDKFSKVFWYDTPEKIQRVTRGFYGCESFRIFSGILDGIEVEEKMRKGDLAAGEDYWERYDVRTQTYKDEKWFNIENVPDGFIKATEYSREELIKAREVFSNKNSEKRKEERARRVNIGKEIIEDVISEVLFEEYEFLW